VRRAPSLPSAYPFLTNDAPLIHHTFPVVQPAPLPSLFVSMAGALLSTRVCLAPISGFWSWLTSTTSATATADSTASSATAAQQKEEDDGVVVVVDAWSSCPSPLLAWSFSYLILDDLLRCRCVSHAWHSLLTAHPLSALCYASASLALPPQGSRWSTRMLATVFTSVPLLSALSFSPLEDSLAASAAADTAVTAPPPAQPTNALRPVPLPSAPPDPRTQHLHSVFLLHHLRVLILPLLTPSLSDVDLFGVSAHLPLLEVLSLQLPAASSGSGASTAAASHSTSLTAVGFSHLSVMQHLAHLSITYHDTPHIDRTAHEEGVRMDMIERQECWLAMMRCKSLRVMQLTREGRAMEEVDVWQQRRRERDEKEDRRRKAEQDKVKATSPPSPSDPASTATAAGASNGSTATTAVPVTPPSPSHNRRASLPIISALHAMELHTQSLLSLPSSSSFSFSLFFSSFSASLLSFTFTSHPTHVADVLLYMDIEQAVLAALPSFQSLLHLNLTLCSFSQANLTALSALSPRLLSFGLSRSLSMSASVPLSPTAGGKLVPATSSWSTIEADSFVSFASSCTRLASLRLHDIPFITADSFPTLLAATPNLHSLHLSLIPLPAAALRCLFDHPLLTYLEVTVDEEQWRGEASGEGGQAAEGRGEEEVAVWLEMGRRYKEWEKRWRLGRMGIGEEEEEDDRDRRQQEQAEQRKKRRWIRDEMLAAGSWDDVLEEEFMNDTDDEDEEAEDGGQSKGNTATALSYRRGVMSVWNELFYLQRLKDGDHVWQGKARRRWLVKQRREQERRQREEEEAWQRQQAMLEEEEVVVNGERVALDNDGGDMEEEKLSDGEMEDEPEDAMDDERRRVEDDARSIGSKRTSPVLAPELDGLVNSHAGAAGKDDAWDVVPL